MPNIFEGAHLSDNAKVTGDALVFGNCRIYGNARVYGDAQVYEDAQRACMKVDWAWTDGSDAVCAGQLRSNFLASRA
jgi:hypothetical protein